MNTVVEITNLTKGALPKAPFGVLAAKILSANYELSLTFVPPAKMRTFSQQYKGDPTHMNVLSFPISKISGEIIVCPATAKTEAKEFDHTYEQHLSYLVIHGMLHLAGYHHGSRMESAEKSWMEKYIDFSTAFSR